MNDSQNNDSNPYNICSCEPEANCKNCNEKEDLNCRFSFAKLFQFYCLFLPFAIPAIIGVEQSGYTTYLWGWVIMAVVFFGLLFFFGGLFKFKCTKCVNFSCVFNRVPKNIVDSYLKKNPIMAKAWEDAGWQIDHTENS